MSHHAHPYPIVIGLTGHIGTGKDTVAQLLHTHCGAHVTAFADALRGEICEAFCIEHMYLTRRETKEHPMSALALNRCMDTAFVDRMVAHHLAGMPQGGIDGERLDLAAPRSPRQIMQWWGTEYRRTNAPGYWTTRTRNHIQWLMSGVNARLVVVSDVRFPNEAEMIRHQLNGYIWQINRPGCNPPAQQHCSEVDGSAFKPDTILNNAHDVRHLQGLVLGEFGALAWGVPGLRVDLPQQPRATEEATA